MKTMVISEFKTKCIAVLKDVYETGTPLVVTRRGKPLVHVESVARCPEKRTLGSLKGWIVAKDDLVHASSSEDWESLS